ncbi:endonuclease/exonuclease/phosphatase family protein [Glaciecola petra]|uniref:Endonuclease/exonuclease/phosphatase family protein n=1 Tax=Glaciecola petra TaxID=3075602 RepID=A0ABU2ZS77_9ALTE|nr:endonuclease/exonuclease/phosphatase family protein [Aestuariibacter sp. P117]MDT0595482.1 endonuclease/exonuclease/phosphatase family protein [Aestuariibacter sp. P117]
MNTSIKAISYLTLLTLVAACTTNKRLMTPTIKVASFNVSMDATNYIGRDPELATNQVLIERLKANHPQIRNIAEIIQRTRPDIILLNEFDFIADPTQGVELFINHYLKQAQHDDLAAIDYPYYYYAPVNTGKPSPYDLNGDGKKTGTQSDAWGFGFFEGHYGMMILSRYPIDKQNVRTFQNFKWKDMPNALRPIAPNATEPFYSDEVWEQYPLSSKSHWDVPIDIDGKVLHLLASHPTPPVFDGEEDRNGTKNHDEVRFWLDYITPNNSAYIYDDNGKKGGLVAQSRFVILGDQNASNTEGDARQEAITALLNSPFVNDNKIPQSDGGDANAPENPLSKYHTASWGMRVDYVLPASFGIEVIKNGVFWPTQTDETYRLIKDRVSSSDHRLVWTELTLK